jgi:hypothetical protein
MLARIDAALAELGRSPTTLLRATRHVFLSGTSRRLGPAMDTTKPSILTGSIKSKVAGSRKKKTAGRSAKLKSSKWYHSAAQSIEITTGRSLESRNDKLG